MSTLKLVAIWGMLACVAVMARHSPWDCVAGLCTIGAMLPLASATGEAKLKRVEIPVTVRRQRR